MKMNPLSNLISPKFAILLSLSVGTAFGVINYWGQATLAQSTNPSALGNDSTGEARTTEGDIPVDSPTGGFNAIDLIHRANLNPSRGIGEFKDDTSRNLNNAAADFKRQQQELLQHQPSNSPSNSTVENRQ